LLILNRVSARCHFHESLNWARLVQKYRQNPKILASHENIGGFTKSVRHTIYDRTKADVEISAPGENLCAYQKVRQISYAPLKKLGAH
jgi:hypothetical protein